MKVSSVAAQALSVAHFVLVTCGSTLTLMVMSAHCFWSGFVAADCQAVEHPKRERD